MTAELDLWRGRRVSVLTPRGRLDHLLVDRVAAVLTAWAPAPAVVDLIRCDVGDTDAAVQLLHVVAGWRRGGQPVIVVNAPPDLAVALRVVHVPAVTTADRFPPLVMADLPADLSAARPRG